MLERIRSTAEYISSKLASKPEVGIILGTGLGALVQEIENQTRLSYNEVPDFPVCTVEGHSGQFIFGELGGKQVVAMQGRFHFYEGYSMQEIALPVRVMKQLGISHLLVSNACGGVNKDFEIGDLMIIDDHINLFPGNPLTGPNIDELGPRFPDMSEPYSQALIQQAESIANNNAINLKKGVYVGLTGPTLETPAEYTMVERIGGDAVGMSTVPEVIAARHMDIPIFAMSIITDLGVPGKIQFVTHEMVQKVAQEAEPKMTLIFRELISSIT